MGKYKILEDGEWQRLRIRNQKHGCCDCGLVHNIDFKIVIKGKRKILEARFKTNKKATSAMRRQIKK